MPISSLFKSHANAPDVVGVTDEKSQTGDDELGYNPSLGATNNVLNVSDSDSIASGQDGVKKAQAATIAWSKKALLISYALIFLIFFINSFQQQISFTLLPFVTSAFLEHSLTATVQVVYTLVAGIIKLPTAKLMDVWGRPQGFTLMLCLTVIGLILMAATNSVTLYAAAQVFYWTGFDGIAYVLDVFIADTSSLSYRGLMLAFSTSPYIVTTFAGPAAGQSFLRGAGWRWGYGVFAIVVPIICVPYLAVFWYNQKQAEKQGIIIERREASGRTLAQSFLHYLIEFDVFGLLLIIAGWTLVLLPLSLATSVASKWQSPSIIAMLVIGFCLLISFALYERFLSPKPFIPFHLLVDRTVLGSCLCAATLFISFYCWDAFFTSYLQVVHNLSPKDAGYVANIYNIGSTFWGIVVGFLIIWTKHYKWLALCAVPLQILGTGLMIFFRQPHWGIGFVVMCQIFIAFSGGTLVITQQVAIMAAVGPANVAVGLALQALFTAVGGAIGQSISGAIWTNTFPQQLARFLPANLQSQIPDIVESIDTQLKFPFGSPGREGIINAYAASQRFMCIAATAVLAMQMVWVLMWRNYNVKDFDARRSKQATVIGG